MDMLLTLLHKKRSSGAYPLATMVMGLLATFTQPLLKRAANTIPRYLGTFCESQWETEPQKDPRTFVGCLPYAACTRPNGQSQLLELPSIRRVSACKVGTDTPSSGQSSKLPQ
jgi:hypothetical protein